MKTTAIGAVLAGGESTRMGTDKAAVELGGRPMLAHVVDALRTAGLDVVVVGSAVDSGIPSIPDPPGLRGPAAGLLAALEHADGRPVLLAATDQPFIQPSSVHQVLAIDDGDAVVPIDNGWPQVTFALYRASCHGPLGDLLSAEPSASIRQLLERVTVHSVPPERWSTWPEDGRSWRSIDTPEDLADAATMV